MTFPHTGADEFHFLLDNSTYEARLRDGGLISRNEAVAKVFYAHDKPTRGA
jgi:hypothetical protein